MGCGRRGTHLGAEGRGGAGRGLVCPRAAPRAPIRGEAGAVARGSQPALPPVHSQEGNIRLPATQSLFLFHVWFSRRLRRDAE